MKRIIALLLALLCVFAFASCATTPEGPTTDGSASIADYNTAIAATTPAGARVTVTYENTAPEITLEGQYDVVYNVDGTATVTYSYEKLNSIGADEMISTVEGTAEVGADGTVTGDLDKTVTAAATKKMNLDESKMTYKISMGALDATIKAADTESILGVALPSDARLLMRITSDGKIGSFSILYTTSWGNASIVCIYE